jgi:hypothetical protein
MKRPKDSLVDKIPPVGMIADKAVPHGPGILAIPRVRFSYPAFEQILTDQAGTARFLRDKQI